MRRPYDTAADFRTVSIDHTTPGWTRPAYHQCDAGCHYGDRVCTGSCTGCCACLGGCVIRELEEAIPA